jgi:hypothetical protein
MSMLTEFKAAIEKHGSVARTNRFKVDFSSLTKLNIASSDEIRDLEYFLEGVNMPSKDVDTIEYSLYRNPIAYAVGYKNGDFSMTFRAPTDMFVKRLFDSWIEIIVPRRSYLMSYRNQIGVDFTITQTSERSAARDRASGLSNYYNVTILDAYPINLGSIEYSNVESDEYVRFTVDFAFRDVQYFDESILRASPAAESSSGNVPSPNLNKSPETPSAPALPSANEAPRKLPEPPRIMGGNNDILASRPFLPRFTTENLL